MIVECNGVTPDLGQCRAFGDHGIVTLSESRVHHPTAIVTGKLVGQISAMRVPVAGREVRMEALIHLACSVFQPRCRPAEFLESRDRGVQVGLVEHFAAVEQVAFDCHNGDLAPLGVEALLRGPMSPRE